MAKSTRKRSRKLDKVDKALRNKTVRFRATDEEEKGLKRAAEKAGLGLSSWLRQLALREAGLLPVKAA